MAKFWSGKRGVSWKICKWLISRRMPDFQRHLVHKGTFEQTKLAVQRQRKTQSMLNTQKPEKMITLGPRKNVHTAALRVPSEIAGRTYFKLWSSFYLTLLGFLNTSNLCRIIQSFSFICSCRSCLSLFLNTFVCHERVFIHMVHTFHVHIQVSCFLTLKLLFLVRRLWCDYKPSYLYL